jgi:acyl-homoserine lactone synthase
MQNVMIAHYVPKSAGVNEMMKAIWGAGITRHPMLMEDIWSFRHRQFVERLRWNEIRRPDGREIDEFDTPRAIHLPLLKNGEIVGYSRLLPTTEPHLLSDVYPELMGGNSWPRGPTVYEWTRCIASEENVDVNGVPASNVLLTGVLEYCLIVGITSLIVETHPKLVNLLVSNDWTVMPLNVPSEHNGHLVLPIEAMPSVRALMTHHRVHAINGSVINIDGTELNPLDGTRSICRLPYLQNRHETTPVGKTDDFRRAG